MEWFKLKGKEIKEISERENDSSWNLDITVLGSSLTIDDLDDDKTYNVMYDCRDTWLRCYETYVVKTDADDTGTIDLRQFKKLDIRNMRDTYVNVVNALIENNISFEELEEIKKSLPSSAKMIISAYSESKLMITFIFDKKYRIEI